MLLPVYYELTNLLSSTTILCTGRYMFKFIFVLGCFVLVQFLLRIEYDRDSEIVFCLFGLYFQYFVLQ